MILRGVPLAARLRREVHTLAGLPWVVRLVWDAHPGYAAALVALNVLQGLQPVLSLWLTKLMVDAIVATIRVGASGAVPGADVARVPWIPATGTTVLWIVLLGALLRLLDRIVEPWATHVQMQLGDYLTREVQTRIMAKATSLQDVSYFENPRFYDSLQRAQEEAGYRPLNILNRLAGLFRAAVQLASLLAVLARFQPLLVLAAVALAVPNLVLQFRSQVDAYAIGLVGTPEVRKMRYFAGVPTGQDTAKEVRLFGLGEYFLQRYLGEFHAFRCRFQALRRRHLRWDLAVSLLTAAGNWALYLYLLVRTLGRRLTLGDLTLASQVLWQSHGRLVELVRQLSGLYADVLFVGRLFEFLDTPPVLPVRPAAEALPPPVPLRQGIEFRDVTFRYAGTERSVLDRLTLRIAPDECIALVGENGAGKTTVVKLLGRLYDPTDGLILVDGVDLRDLDLVTWRQQLGAIFQDFGEYVGTVRTNVGLGYLPKIEDLASVQAAAARGGAAEFVEALPHRYDTFLGRWVSAEGVDGVELSGGEWQKVALSRAFMREGAQLLILDEPTAALDTQAEYDAYLRFRELTRGRATLLISHRFSTVKMADRIVVLEHGRVVEQGSHAELMARRGTYADLYEKQASRYR